MDINAAFPSDYLKAADLRGQEVTVTIRDIEIVDLGGETKPVIHFEGKEKGMVLNKTNARVIASMHGNETNNWPGKQITLMSTQTDFQGRVVPCIRVKLQNLMTNTAEDLPF